MGKRGITLPVSGITGKATSATARALTKVSTDLEIKIRKLKDKDSLTKREEARLDLLEKQLDDVQKEMAEESTKAGRNINQKRSDKKAKPVTLSRGPKGTEPEIGAGKSVMSAFNVGGMPSRKGIYDMRKGGMFMKGTK
tara:strand:+ start:57 stop:473 length:417 start_codon:yes stop_codon:yes gene_type:complete